MLATGIGRGGSELTSYRCDGWHRQCRELHQRLRGQHQALHVLRWTRLNAAEEDSGQAWTTTKGAPSSTKGRGRSSARSRLHSTEDRRISNSSYIPSIPPECSNQHRQISSLREHPQRRLPATAGQLVEQDPKQLDGGQNAEQDYRWQSPGLGCESAAAGDEVDGGTGGGCRCKGAAEGRARWEEA